MLGNYFIVNVKTGFTSNQKTFNLENTVNYEDLLDIVKTNFSQAKPLLEEVIQDIAEETKEKYPFISYLFVSIKKNNPPLAGEIESSEVSFEKEY